MKIQIMGGKVCLRHKGKTLLGVVNKLLNAKSFTEGSGYSIVDNTMESYKIKSAFPFKIFSTLNKI